MTENSKKGNRVRLLPKLKQDNFASSQESSCHTSVVDLARMTIESMTTVFTEALAYQHNCVNLSIDKLEDNLDNFAINHKVRELREIEEYCVKYTKAK